jgi:hypothetical protein
MITALPNSTLQIKKRGVCVQQKCCDWFFDFQEQRSLRGDCTQSQFHVLSHQTDPIVSTVSFTATG